MTKTPQQLREEVERGKYRVNTYGRSLRYLGVEPKATVITGIS